MTKHVHTFTKRKPTSTVATCICGAFRHVDVKPEDVIVNVPVKPRRTLAEWAKDWPYTVRLLNAVQGSRVHVTPDASDDYRALRVEAFDLIDYQVSSVCGGSIYFVPRNREIR